MTNETGDYKFTVNAGAAASNRGGRLFSSNLTGASIWRRIVQQVPFEAIAGEISCEYRIALTTAREDTARFLAELERNNLIARTGKL